MNQAWARTQSPLPEVQFTPKWPAAAAVAGEYAELPLFPVSLTLRATTLDDPNHVFELDLFDPTIAQPSQTLRLDENQFKIRLSDSSWSDLGQIFPIGQDELAKRVNDAVDVLQNAAGPTEPICQSLAVLATAIQTCRDADLGGTANDDLVAAIQKIIPSFTVAFTTNSDPQRVEEDACVSEAPGQ